MRSDMRSSVILILVTECFLTIHAIQSTANYRSLVPTRRFQSNRRYKDYRTLNYNQRQPTLNYNQRHPSRKPVQSCQYSPSQSPKQSHSYQPPSHLIRPRSIEPQCVRQRREKQWHNIAEVKRDIENNPSQPTTTTTQEPSTEPPEPPKPKVKKQKQVKVEMVKVTTIYNTNEDMQRPPMMGPPIGYTGPPNFMGPPPGYNGPPPNFQGYAPAQTMGPIPRWSNQGPPPPWAYAERPAWNNEPPRRWSSSAGRTRQKPKDALDKILSDGDMKTKTGGSEEKWPLKGDSERHRWESREGSDIYWELESTKKLASWDPNKSSGPLWKGASKSSSGGGKKKWEDTLDDFAGLKDGDRWNEAEHGGVPKPPLQYLKEYRRP